jgi:acyl-CoA synthetase (NDP forming)
MTARPLDPFFKPHSVAIIGLSRSAVGAPVSVLTSLEGLGYEGRVYVINPSFASSGAIKAFARIEDLPEVVDLAIVSVERNSVPGILEECAARGIRSAIVITQGFADADDVGHRLQEEVIAICQRTGMRILGPNTIGVANALAKFTSSFIEVRGDLTPIGQVAQSGLFMMGHHLINNEPSGFCMSIDLGNSANIGLVEVLDYFEQEDAVKVVQCHLEAVTDGPGFITSASRVSRHKPIVALKAGTTAAGQAAVASHTGAIAGSNRVYGAAFRKAGIVQAHNAEDLRMLSKAFTIYPPADGKRVAIMSFSGGGAILAIDSLDRAGLELATLSDETKDTVQSLFPAWIGVDNPLDIWIPVAKDFNTAFPTVLEALLKDSQVDAVLCIYCSYPLPKYGLFDSSKYIDEIASRYPEKPVLCWSYGLDIEGFTRKVEAGGHAMVFQSLDDAASALSKLVEYGTHRSRKRGPAVASRNEDAAQSVRASIERARKAQQSYLFVEGLEILDAYGVKLAPWRLINSERELLSDGGTLNFPICLKLVSPDVIHKSDGGGVVLGLRDTDSLVAAYRRMRELLPVKPASAGVSGILAQEMIAGGREVMIGMKRDAAFGPCVVFGTGGIYAEVLDDFSFRLAPVDRDEALELIAETRVAKILKGVRGEAPYDIDGIADAIVRVSEIAVAHPEIAEIDLNPLFVKQQETVAVDARFILSL